MSEEQVITGTISAILPIEPISNGKYRKQVFAITNYEGYNAKEQTFAFEIFEAVDPEKKKIDNFIKFNSVGQKVDVSYEIRCNENAGRYFTSLSAWKVFANKDASDPANPAPADEVLDEEPPF
jgi:hypothetical protein